MIKLVLKYENKFVLEIQDINITMMLTTERLSTYTLTTLLYLLFIIQTGKLTYTLTLLLYPIFI